MISLRNLFKLLKIKVFRFCGKLLNFQQRQLILNSGYFDATFSLPSGIQIEDPIDWYLNQTRNNTTSRKPMPGFHPGIYAEYVDTGDVEPFVHFLRNGRPEGPWLYEVIGPSARGGRAVDSLTAGQCALHIHLHYYDQAEAVLRIITQLQSRPDIKISVTSREGEDHVLALLDELVIKGADVRLVPNRGRNIGPFLTEFGRDLQKYKVIGHIHAKKSVLLNDNCMV